MQAQIYKTQKLKHTIWKLISHARYQLRCVCFSFHDFINHVASLTLSERGTPTEVTFFRKKREKAPPLENRSGPYKWLGFAHFLSTFSSVQKEKMTFWPCFWAIFARPPDPLEIDFFNILKKKFNIR